MPRRRWVFLTILALKALFGTTAAWNTFVSCAAKLPPLLIPATPAAPLPESSKLIKTSGSAISSGFTADLQSLLSQLHAAELHSESQKPSPRASGLHLAAHQPSDRGQSPPSNRQSALWHCIWHDPSPSHSGWHAGEQAFSIGVNDGAPVDSMVGGRVSTTGALVSSQSPRSNLHASVLHSMLQVLSPSQNSGHEQTSTGGSVGTDAQSPSSNRQASLMQTRSHFLSPSHLSRQPAAHIFSVGGIVGASVILYVGGSVCGRVSHDSPSQLPEKGNSACCCRRVICVRGAHPVSHAQRPATRSHTPCP